jgi:hypothetical protein
MRWLLLSGWLLLSLGAGAWEEEPVLEYILAYNPLIQAQRTVTDQYQPPATWRKLLEHTSVYARAATGTSTSVSQAGETTVSTPMTVGIQVTIPLASPKEQREHAEKRAQELAKLDEVRSRILQDMAQLRQHEANLVAAEAQREFFSKKSEWLQDRVKQGYEEAEVLWDNSQKLNALAAEVMKLKLLVDSQRQQLAHYAGEHWKELLAYLQGKRQRLAKE